MGGGGSLVSYLGWILGLLFVSRQSLVINPGGDGVVSKQYRSAFHFQPPRNWMNDPNAPMYYKGVYHLFYQSNPSAAVWTSNISWGHSISTDLIHWTGLGLAFTPSNPFDIGGCWSGSATILPGNKPAILYTGLDTKNRQVQNVAYPKNLSDPCLREWVKPDYNPLLEAVDGLDAEFFRDPTTAWVGSDGDWRIVVGAVSGRTGQAVLYRSKDFKTWVRAENPLHFTNGSGMWECPDFFPLGKGKYVLKISLFDTLTERYIVGRYDEVRDAFVGDDASANDYQRWQRVDHGSFYASKTFFDEAKQRRILWGWSNESDSRADDVAKGWAGVQIVPRVLSLDPSGTQLIQWPIEEIKSLRKNQVKMLNIELETGKPVEIKGLSASQADVEVEFELPSLELTEPFDPNWLSDPPMLCRKNGATIGGTAGPFGLLVLASERLDEYTAIYFRVFNAGKSYAVLMCADQRKSSLRAELYKPAFGGFLDVNIKKGNNGKVSLRTLIDHSIVESFGGGGRTCITSRVYPTYLAKGRAHLFAFNNGSVSVKISELRAWNMAKARIS